MGNPPPSQLRQHQSFNLPASSSGIHGQHRAQAPKRTTSHCTQLSTNVPQICISLEPGEQLDPGLKQDISQKVRELRAQKLNERGRSPGPSREHNQAAGHGPSKGPSKSHSSQGLVSQSNVAHKPYLLPSNQKEKPRDRPLSTPSQAAIQRHVSPDSKLKAPQAYPQSQGEVQRPQSGSISLSIPAINLVSPRVRASSHSPCRRIEVDIEEECQGGLQKGMRSAISQECLMLPSDLEVTAFDETDFLSQSFPAGQINLARARQRGNFFSPASGSGNFLPIPDNHVLSPPDGQRGFLGQNGRRGSTSDIGALTRAGLLSSSPTGPAPWLCLSPRTSPKTSPTGSPSSSSNTLSPPFSPDFPMNYMNYQSSTLMPNDLFMLNQAHSQSSTPCCSPSRSPFGSRNQIHISSAC